MKICKKSSPLFIILVNSLICVTTPNLLVESTSSYDRGEEEEGYCAPYNGKVCKAFINSRQVWYSREDGTGGWENEKITTALFSDLISDLPEYCKNAAEVSILFGINGHSLLCRLFGDDIFYYFV